nr:uncharacterized protein LOC109742458 [Aegilops tauschii subsp. strangulata]
MAADTGVTGSPERSKTTRADDDVDQEEEREAKKMKTNLDTEEDADDSDDDDEEELEVPSPIREPYIPDRLKNRFGMAHPTISATYQRAETKFLDKRGRTEKQLPTRQYFRTSLVPLPDSGSKAVLFAARSIIRLSSSLGGEPLAQSAGFWIDWDEGSGTGVVLMAAHLICAKKPLAKDHWRHKDRYQYHPGAQVTVHLLYDTTAEGRLLYHQQHYDLAFFKVAVDRCVQLTSFADTVNVGQEALRLGREENLNLRITHGRVKPDDRHHCMCFYRDKKYIS